MATGFVFLLFGLGTTGYVLGIPLSPWHFWLALGLTPVAAWWLPGRRRPKVHLRRFGTACAGFAGILLLSVAGSERVYDCSWDGQAYHQEAVIRLAEGWNPFRQVCPSQPNAHTMQLQHFPKASWIAEAVIYVATGRIEAGKTVNWLLLAGAFCAALAFFLSMRKWPKGVSVWLAALVSWTPVTACQAFTYYQDGQLMSLFVSLAVSLLVLARGKGGGPWAVALSGCSLPLLVNLKFTGIAYTGLLVAGLLIHRLVISRSFHETARLALFCVGVAGLSLLFFGYNPYVTNALRNGHPLHPMAGPEAYYEKVFSVKDRPADFQNLSPAHRLFRSVFAVSEDAMTPRSSHAKLPFSVSWVEVAEFRTGYQVRVAGWGPFFGGALILASLLLAWLFWTHPRIAGGSIPLLAVILATLFVNPEAWWARYAPQAWLLPCVVAGAALMAGGWARRFAFVLLAVLSLNVGLVSAANLRGALVESRKIGRQLERINLKRQPVVIHFGWFRSLRVRLTEAGIHFREVQEPSELPFGSRARMVGTEAVFCWEVPGTTGSRGVTGGSAVPEAHGFPVSFR